MHVAILAYSVGGVSLALTFTVTVLNGVRYASANNALELTSIIFGCLNCIGQVALLFLLAKVFKGRSRLLSDLEMSGDHSSMRAKMISKCRSPTSDSQRPSMSIEPKMSTDDGLAPIQLSASSVSNRYSGRTLFQQDSKRSSLDQSTAGLVSSDKPEETVDDTCSVTEDRNGARKIQRSHSEIKRSLDSVVHLPSPGPSSPTASSINLELPARPPPPKLKITRDSNIHPLFRADNPSPPPTPTLRTIVKASPVAGQTITMKTLSRVRSTNSLRVHGPRSRSPLFERMDQNDADMEGPLEASETTDSNGKDNMPGFILAADVRRSISQYEKRYDLNESPHES